MVHCRRAFVMVEAATCVIAVALASALGVVAAAKSRQSAGLAGSLANLGRIGEATGAFAADAADQLWSFTWTVDHCPSQYADLQVATDNVRAIANQAVDIVRRRFDEDQPRLTNRMVAPWLSTLVLVDYLDEQLPAEWAVSPGDEARLRWRADPHNPPALGEQGGAAWDALFAPFGSSYILMPAFFAPDERVDDEPTIEQYPYDHNLYRAYGVVFGTRTVAEIAFPSRKAHMAERASYFFGPRPVHFLHAQARLPVLTADGSVSARTSADANASFRPNNPLDGDGTSVTDYMPNPLYEPAALSGGDRDSRLETHYKWTRHGLRGLDFDGERVE